MKKFVSISSVAAITAGFIAPVPTLAEEIPTQSGSKQLSSNNSTTETAEPSNSSDQQQDIVEVRRLGKIKDATALLYKIPGNESGAETASANQLQKSYYIQHQVNVNDEIYYLLSTSSEADPTQEIGWVKEKDLESYARKILELKNVPSTVYLNNDAAIYEDHAWAGEQLLKADFTINTDEPFTIKSVEKVGEDIWYGITKQDSDEVVWVKAEETSTKEATLNPESEEIKNEPAKPSIKEPVAKEAAKAQSKPATVAKSAKVISTPIESTTSRLGQISSTSTKIFKTLGDNSSAFQAGNTYVKAVYYIKKQASFEGKTYYLISTSPSSTKGVIGWVDSADVKSYEHVGVDRTKRSLTLTGKGTSYSKAWGGSKDLMYNLADFKDQTFNVNLTERVGNNIWYRGILKGQTVWIHSSYTKPIVSQSSVSSTSRLGHIRSTTRLIYDIPGDESTTFPAGNKYTNAVYYIKKQADYDGTRYYLLSTKPSSTSGVVGWVKSSDLSTNVHKGYSKKKSSGILNGKGQGFTKAWGGKKDVVYNLSNYKDSIFQINLIETVGKNKWYRGTLEGKTVWIHSSGISSIGQTSSNVKEVTRSYTDYNKTLQEMVDIQMKVNPQTDKRYGLWIHSDAFSSVKNDKGTVKTAYNIRRGPGPSYGVQKVAKAGETLPILDSANVGGVTWYQVGVRSGWGTAERYDVEYYMDSANFLGSFQSSLQFADLSSSAGLDANEVNEKILKGKGILEGRAADFIEAGRTYGVNEVYLIAHALLETGNGSSQLANGNKYKNTGVTVYNMYGIGAYDNTALQSGIERAYKEGWTTPRAAIIGGAKFVGEEYVNAGQNTIYKMRWNSDFADAKGYASHQYATDIGWAAKQTSRMESLYNLLDNYKINLIIPRFK